MTKDSQHKTPNQKGSSRTSLQAGGANTPAPLKSTPQDQRPAHWDRYVDSRLKQFCLR
jgi:hypothetical protein